MHPDRPRKRDRLSAGGFATPARTALLLRLIEPRGWSRAWRACRNETFSPHDRSSTTATTSFRWRRVAKNFAGYFMNNHAELIRTALERRYARLPLPACPDKSWRVEEAKAAVKVGPIARSRTFAYLSAALVVMAIAGLSANASTVITQTYMRFMGTGSSKPLPPMIHAADRLTIEEAQRRMPFAIVEPKALPEHTLLRYAGVGKELPITRVSLFYETHIANRYYRIIFGESTVEGPASTPVVLEGRNGKVKRYALQIRRWRHGPLFFSLVAPGLPDDISARIVRANAN